MSGNFQSSPSMLGNRAIEMKAPSAFRTISEVATNLEVPQHVLRFWETKFQQVSPLKRGGGRRYYRPEDVALLTNIKELLYNQGFTIRGVQKLLKESRSSAPKSDSLLMAAAPATANASPVFAQSAVKAFSADKRRALESVLTELKSLRELLRASGV